MGNVPPSPNPGGLRASTILRPLRPLIILGTVAFWTWLWGPVGLVLATPLTVCLLVLAKYVPEMDFVAILVSDEPALETSVSYCQRLVAQDLDEARDIVEEFIKSHPAGDVYDGLLIPALIAAKRDRARRRLSEDGEAFIVRATLLAGDLLDLLDEGGAEMKATDILKRQHREVRGLFKKVDKTEDARGRRQLLDQITQALELHTRLEEEIFYPAVRGLECVSGTTQTPRRNLAYDNTHDRVDDGE